MAKAMENKSLEASIVERRSIRKIKNTPKLDKSRIEEILKVALHAPSAFNMQSGRLVVLTEESHKELWELTKAALKEIVPEENFAATEQKLDQFKQGLGTILFFEDEGTVKKYQEQAPTYAEHFPSWSQQGSGYLQYAVWLALSAEGLGVSIQHYNPLIDGKVREKWGIPQEWKHIGQMPFGWPDEEPGERSFLPFDQVVKFY